MCNFYVSSLQSSHKSQIHIRTFPERTASKLEANKVLLVTHLEEVQGNSTGKWWWAMATTLRENIHGKFWHLVGILDFCKGFSHQWLSVPIRITHHSTKEPENSDGQLVKNASIPHNTQPPVTWNIFRELAMLLNYKKESLFLFGTVCPGCHLCVRVRAAKVLERRAKSPWLKMSWCEGLWIEYLGMLKCHVCYVEQQTHSRCLERIVLIHSNSFLWGTLKTYFLLLKVSLNWKHLKLNLRTDTSLKPDVGFG